MQNQSSPFNFWRWFDPRFRKPGTWAFIINRITGLGLTLYLFLHLIMLGKLSQGPEAYDSFITLAHSPIFKFGEMFVIAGGILHGLNGIRVGMTSFGIGVIHQKKFLAVLSIISAILIIYFGYVMFAGA